MHPLHGRQLRMFLMAAALGGSPSESDEETLVSVEVDRREVRVGGRLTRSLHLGKWPRSLAPGFLQGLMAAGAPMDLSVHLGPIPAEQAARTLEWQKVALRVGPVACPCVGAARCPPRRRSPLRT